MVSGGFGKCFGVGNLSGGVNFSLMCQTCVHVHACHACHIYYIIYPGTFQLQEADDEPP